MTTGVVAETEPDNEAASRNNQAAMETEPDSKQRRPVEGRGEAEQQGAGRGGPGNNARSRE